MSSSSTSFAVTEPKTKQFVAARQGQRRRGEGRSSIAAAFDENTYKAARNVQPTLLVTAREVNTEQLLAFRKIIVTNDALPQLAERTRQIMNEPFDIIDTHPPHGKGTLLSEKQNKYVFRVKPHANKIQIKHAIEQLFKKTVIAVNTCNYAGKKKRERTAAFGRKAHWKKAIVTLKEGDKIDLA